VRLRSRRRPPPALGLAERAPTRLALLGTLPRKRERGKKAAARRGGRRAFSRHSRGHLWLLRSSAAFLAAVYRSLSRLRGRVGVGALSAVGLAERAPTRLAEFIIGRRFAPTRWLGTLPRKRERGRKRPHGVAEDVQSVVVAAAIYGSFDRLPLSPRDGLSLTSPACGGGLGWGLSRHSDSRREPPPASRNLSSGGASRRPVGSAPSPASGRGGRKRPRCVAEDVQSVVVAAPFMAPSIVCRFSSVCRSLSRLRGRVGGALSALGLAERAPTRLALLGTLPRKREREKGGTPAPVQAE
jgi:hypothetical protein